MQYSIPKMSIALGDPKSDDKVKLQAMEHSSPNSIETCDNNDKKEKRNPVGKVTLVVTKFQENERSSVLVSQPSKEPDITTQKGIRIVVCQ